MNVPAARIVFSDEDRAAVLSMVDQTLQTGSLTLGPYTRELEDAFRARHDAPFAVAVSSGTSAIEIILPAGFVLLLVHYLLRALGVALGSTK